MGMTVRGQPAVFMDVRLASLYLGLAVYRVFRIRIVTSGFIK